MTAKAQSKSRAKRKPLRIWCVVDAFGVAAAANHLHVARAKKRKCEERWPDLCPFRVVRFVEDRSK